MDLVDVLVNAHSKLDTTEDLLKSTKEKVMACINSLENSIISEDNRDTGHLTDIYQALQPVLQKYAALRELHESLTALKEKVPRNDATTNALKINAEKVKKMTKQLSNLNDVRSDRQEHSLRDGATPNYGILVAQMITAMSLFRKSLDAMDRFLSRSDVWNNLKSTVDHQTLGIAGYCNGKYPASTINEYLKNKCGMSLQSSPPTKSSGDATCTAREEASGFNDIRLEPWTSTSALTTIRTSCVSSSEVLSGKMTSDILRSYIDQDYDSDEVNVDCGE